MNKTRLIYWSSVALGVLPFPGKRCYFVLGFPKSGTSWTFQLLSDYLELPRLKPSKRYWPCFGSCVIKAHRFLPGDSVRKRTIYVVRDGRDVVISYYMSLVRGEPRNRAAIEKSLGATLAADRIRDHLPKFLLHCRDNKRASIPYRDHVFHALKRGYSMIRYEDLLENGEETFAKAVELLLGRPADFDRIRQVLHDNDFKTRTGRERGVEAKRVFMRKGIAGDWRNHFSRESAEIFNDYAGDVLVELGYESDRDWVQSVAA
jgi:hypothetical protein